MRAAQDTCVSSDKDWRRTAAPVFMCSSERIMRAAQDTCVSSDKN